MAMGALIGGAVIGGIGKIKAGKDAQKLAKENAANMRAETEEAARRLEAQQAENLSTAKARAFASGTTGEGSQESFINKMGTEYTKELEWLKKSGASAAAIEERRGKYERDALRWSAIGGIASGIGGAAGDWSWSSPSGTTGGAGTWRNSQSEANSPFFGKAGR